MTGLMTDHVLTGTHGAADEGMRPGPATARLAR